MTGGRVWFAQIFLEAAASLGLGAGVGDRDRVISRRDGGAVFETGFAAHAVKGVEEADEVALGAVDEAVEVGNAGARGFGVEGEGDVVGGGEVWVEGGVEFEVGGIAEFDEAGEEGFGALDFEAGAGEFGDELNLDVVRGAEGGEVAIEGIDESGVVVGSEEEFDAGVGVADGGGAFGAVGGADGFALRGDGAFGLGAVAAGGFALGLGARALGGSRHSDWVSF